MRDKLKEFYHKYDYKIEFIYILSTITQVFIYILIGILILFLGNKEVKALDTYNGVMYNYNTLGTWINVTPATKGNSDCNGVITSSYYYLINSSGKSILIDLARYNFIKGHNYTIKVTATMNLAVRGMSVGNWNPMQNVSIVTGERWGVCPNAGWTYSADFNISSDNITAVWLYADNPASMAGQYLRLFYDITDNGIDYSNNLNNIDDSINDVNSSITDNTSTSDNQNNEFINKFNGLFSGVGEDFLLQFFTIPVNFIKTIIDSSDKCQSISLGSMFGFEFIMPCLDFESILGSNIYHIIDVIFTGCIALAFVSQVGSIFNDLLELNDKASKKLQIKIFK